MNTQQLKKRVHTVQGQLDGIIKMMEEGKNCIDVLNQFKAARAGLEKLLSLFLEDNLKKCLDLSKLTPKRQTEIEKIIAELTKF
jgi:DNA-binding FrmR family transcriptional regulator